VTALSVQVPYPVFYNRDGQPIDNGNIYIGVANLNPVTNPIQVYYDEALTILASQPLKTSNGYIYRNGTPTQLYVNGVNFSILVKDSKGLLVYSFPDGTSISPNASGVIYNQGSLNAVDRTVTNRLQDCVSVKDFGAVGDGVTDDLVAFENAANYDTVTQVLIPAGSYYLSGIPIIPGSVTWIVDRNVTFTGIDILTYVNNRIISFGGYRSIESDPSFYNGIFGYLEQNAGLSAYSTIGLHGSARSVGGVGGPSEADIAVSAFGYNDLEGGLQGVWGLYSTVMRAPAGGGGAILGPTHGMEIDVANMGATVPIWPSTPFAQGLTSGAWICSGGESSEPSAGGSPGAASVAVGIIRNDSQAVKTASFEKGIVFHNQAILGTDGATGDGVAIALATGHLMHWYNNNNQLCAEISASGRTFANTNWRMDFSDAGIVFQDRNTGINSLAITKPSTPANGLNIAGSETGSPVIISAQGNDTNIDLVIAAKGTGSIDLRNVVISGSSGASAGYLPVKVNGVSYKIQLFNV
jgi:hypothetical protein